MTINGSYFYGNKISEYGLEHGYVDYRTLAKAFDAVLNNEVLKKTEGVVGCWEQVSGFDNEVQSLWEELEALTNELEEGSGDEFELHERIENIRDEIADREYEQEQPEIFQWYIVSRSGAEILERIEEIVYYNDELDLYLWGVTHWGTSWDYVLTNIKIER